MRKEAARLDDEADIADNPVLAAIDLELQSINRRGDIKLLVALPTILAIVLLLGQLQIKNSWIDALGVAIVIAILGGTIYSVVRQKLGVAIKHGLVCSNCRTRPRVHMILSTAHTQRCRKCGTRLNVV